MSSGGTVLEVSPGTHDHQPLFAAHLPRCMLCRCPFMETSLARSCSDRRPLVVFRTLFTVFRKSKSLQQGVLALV